MTATSLKHWSHLLSISYKPRATHASLNVSNLRPSIVRRSSNDVHPFLAIKSVRKKYRLPIEGLTKYILPMMPPTFRCRLSQVLFFLSQVKWRGKSLYNISLAFGLFWRFALKYSAKVVFQRVSELRTSSSLSLASNVTWCWPGRWICKGMTAMDQSCILNSNNLQRASDADTYRASRNCLISSTFWMATVAQSWPLNTYLNRYFTADIEEQIWRKYPKMVNARKIN